MLIHLWCNIDYRKRVNITKRVPDFRHRRRLRGDWSIQNMPSAYRRSFLLGAILSLRNQAPGHPHRAWCLGSVRPSPPLLWDAWHMGRAPIVRPGPLCFSGVPREGASFCHYAPLALQLKVTAPICSQRFAALNFAKFLCLKVFRAQQSENSVFEDQMSNKIKWNNNSTTFIHCSEVQGTHSTFSAKRAS